MTDIFEICNNENRIVHGWLLHTEERRQRYNRKCEEILQGGKCAMNGEESVQAFTGCGGVTATKALKLADERMVSDAQWLGFIDDVIMNLSEEWRIFLNIRRDHRFCTGSNPWRPAVARKYAEAIAVLKGISIDEAYRTEATISAYWHELVDSVAREGVRRGMFGGDLGC